MISSAEMCKLAGCSYRQLDYWTRQRVVLPARPACGTGTPRRWSERQVRNVRLVTALAALGAQQAVLQRASAVADLLPEDAWVGTAYVDMEGIVTFSPPVVPSWAVDLAPCALRSPLARQLALA